VQRFSVEPATALYIDDSPANIEGATTLGFCTIRFTDATALRCELVRLELLAGVRDGSPGRPT
jgi:2-haloacid dehalogenase